MNFMERLFFRLTARRWNALISSSLCQAHEVGLINSEQLHSLAHEFDPTQGGRVGRIVMTGTNVQYTDALLRQRSN